METNYKILLEDLIKELINNGYLTDQAISCRLMNDPDLLVTEPQILNEGITMVGVVNKVQQKIQEIVGGFNIEEAIEQVQSWNGEELEEEPIEELEEEPTEEPEPTYVTISYELGEFPDKFRDNVTKKLPVSKQVEIGYTLTAEDLPSINLTKTQANVIGDQTVGYNKNIGDVIDSDIMISFGIII